jgi:hypothetical protein
LLVAAASLAPAQVVISEIHYHPVEEPAFDSTANYNPVLDLSEDVHEFVEIQNPGTAAVDLSGWTLSGAVDYPFPAGTSIAAGGFKVIAKNPARIQTVYAISGVLGPYTGKLSNRGASVRIKDAANTTVDAVTYSAGFPWAQSANALGAQDRFTNLNSATYQYKGRSLQRVSATANSSDPANWLASPLTGPTPGAAQAITRAVPKPVVIAKSHAQTSTGSGVILASQAATIHCTFSSTVSLSAVQLEWFVDLVDSTAETRTTAAMTDLGHGEFTATIPGQAVRSIVRYRIKANRGDGAEVVSPRADDPVIAAVGASNAVEPWHGYFVAPTGRSTTYPNYDLLLGATNLAKIKTNATQSPARVTAATAAGLPRSVPWVAATAPLWDGTVPAVFAYNGELFDVRIRFHGSRYHRASYANTVATNSFKLHFPENQPFRDKTSWFITPHKQEYDEATRLNRLLGLPASQTRFVSWYLNSNTVVTKLEQGEYGSEMLDDYHNSRYASNPGSTPEANGDLYKDVGNRDNSASNLEGPYTCGDLAAITANANWTKYQRYESTYSLQTNAWKGPRPFATMLEGLWAARGDTTATHNYSTIPAQLAATKAWFNTNYDMDATLTSMALVQWMSIWDDGKQNQFYWRRANGKWVRLGWDYDSVMTASGGGGPGGGGSYTQTIWGGEYGATNVFDGVNWWKDSFYKCFRDEYKQRLWQLNNSFFDPQNLLALGFTTTSKAYLFAQVRQAQVNTQLALGTYYKPVRPTNSTPTTGSTVLAGASLKSSAYSHPSSKTHLSTKWEIRAAAGNYEQPVYAVTSATNLTTLPIPYDSLTFGQTYFWRVTYTDADSHASIISAETSFTWNTASAVAGDLKLNEILADNRATIANDGTWPDYIELRNNGSSAYDLTGITLTDDVNLPAKYTFPAGNTLAAGGHLVVWCDGNATAPGLHTGFGLAASGQTVLMMRGTSVLDSITFGPQAPDLSLGRIANGTGTWTANTPTPAAANTAAALGTTATLTVNEWMASPAYGDDWFELYNSGTAPVALAGLYLSDNAAGPTTTQIPALSYIGAGGFTRFLANGSIAGGNACNFKLSASGESIVLTAANGTTNLDIINFSTQTPDVSQGRFPDGGATLAALTTTASPEASNWLPAPVVINEALANPAAGDQDWLELHNPGSTPIDLAGWWLSDDLSTPKKYQLPAGTSLPAGGYLVVTAAQFGAGTIPFGLNSDGDHACLAAADGAGALTGYRAQISFGASASGVSFGRIPATGLPNGKGGAEFWPLTATTPATANAAPLTTPVIINEIMYHPVDAAGGLDVTATEFIELHNRSNAAVALSGWRLKADSDFTFLAGTSLPACGYGVVVGFDPTADPASLATFRTTYGLSAAVPISGPFSPKLANNTHRLELAYPDANGASITYVNVDQVEYRDLAPWPTAPDGTGTSLQRHSRAEIGNTAANWASAAPTPGALNAGLYSALAVWSENPVSPATGGVSYSFDFVGVGGSPAYSWSLAGGYLPTGLEIANGQLTGTPTLTGEFSFIVRLTDATTSTTQVFDLTVLPNSTDSDADGMPDSWEIANGLQENTDDSATDADGDGQPNLAEYLAGTNPQAAASVFAIQSITTTAADQITLTWPGVSGRSYQVWSSPDLGDWTAVGPVIPCAATGPLSANVPTAGASRLFFKLSVLP